MTDFEFLIFKFVLFLTSLIALVLIAKSHGGASRNPSQELTFEGNCESALHICEKALLQMGANIRARENNSILALTDISWKSFGEWIGVNIIRHDGHNVTIEITSTSRLSTTILDFGKNGENVSLLVEIIEANKKT